MNGEISCFPFFLSGKFTKNCTSCKMECHHILHFLFVRGLTTILQVGELGVEDQQNGLRKVPTFLHVIYFCRVRPQREPSALDGLEQQIRDIFLPFFLIDKGKVLCLCL
jgi:hypothetical protein